MRITMASSLLSFILLVGSCIGQEPCPNDAIWCDEFDIPGEPQQEYWKYDIGKTGWGNSESQNYSDTNAAVKDDGFLHIKVTRNGDDFTSSRIKTEDKVSFLYARIEASIKIPDLTGGLWPAIWLLGTNFAEIGWPQCGEIDISEWGSEEAIQENRLDTTSSSAMHWDENGHTFDFEYLVDVDPPNLEEAFHTYAVDWTPTEITFFVDNVQVFSKNTTDLEEFQKPFFMLVNVAVGGTYTGIFTPTSQGGDLLVDWIRVYDNGHTEVTVAECDSCDPPDNSGAVGNSILYRWFTSTLLTFMGLTSMASLFV